MYKACVDVDWNVILTATKTNYYMSVFDMSRILYRRKLVTSLLCYIVFLCTSDNSKALTNVVIVSYEKV